MDGIIHAEWDPLKKVVIHRPDIEMFFGLLDPHSSLYERAFSREGALREHEILENTLRKEFKIEVIRLKDAIIQAADERPDVRNKLITMARSTITHVGDTENIEQSLKEFDRNAKYLDSAHFFNILVLNPGIEFHMKENYRNINLNILGKQPLCNLYFMRDQQFVTDQGIVMTRMASETRRNEPIVTKFLWHDIMNLPIAHEMTSPATIEGGEFIPMGKFALVGIGSRTNQAAIDQLMKIPFQYEEIGVVHQPMHPLVPSDDPDPMINMHLDTYFNVPARDLVVGNELLLQNAKVDIYHNEGNGSFVKGKKQTTLTEYIQSKGFHIIPITTLEQMSYASNFLCIKDRKILAIEVERGVRDVMANLQSKAKEDPQRYNKLLAQAKADFDKLMSEGQFFPHKKEIYEAGIDAYPIILKNLTGGYGGAHCMTCSLTRG